MTRTVRLTYQIEEDVPAGHSNVVVADQRRQMTLVFSDEVVAAARRVFELKKACEAAPSVARVVSHVEAENDWLLLTAAMGDSVGQAIRMTAKDWIVGPAPASQDGSAVVTAAHGDHRQLP